MPYRASVGRLLLVAARIACCAALVAVAGPAPAQLPAAAIEKHIDAIPAAQRALHARLGKFAKRSGRYTGPGGDGEVTGYFEERELRKLVVSFDGDGASWVETYYFDREGLFLATLRWQTFQIHPGQTETVSEARYDFGHQTLLRWQKRGYPVQAKRRPRFEVETDQVRIASQQEDLLRRVARYRKFLESGGSELPE